jgi:hypothetical protein
MKTDLVGMFLVLDDPGHEYFRTGSIVAASAIATSSSLTR